MTEALLTVVLAITVAKNDKMREHIGGHIIRKEIDFFSCGFCGFCQLKSQLRVVHAPTVPYSARFAVLFTGVTV